MKYKRSILIFIYVICGLSLFSQNKEIDFTVSLYDSLYYRLVDIKYRPLDSINANRTNIYGDGMSYVLVADLIMFENTYNPKYLNRFLINSTGMMLYRRDFIDSNDEPRWGKDPSMYHDGLIMWAYSYFIYRVNTLNPLFSNFSISDSLVVPISKLDSNLYTLKNISDKFEKEITKTLEFYNRYWFGSKIGFKTSQSKKARPAHLNFQSAFGATYYYIGMVSKNNEYLQRAHQLAALYRSVVKDKPNCAAGTAIPPFSKRNVLEVTEDSCLIWRHWGWRPAQCKNDFQAMDYDDISHGIQAFIFPMTILNKFKLNDRFYFSDNDMIYLHNTFTKRIFAGYTDNGPTFNPTLDGDTIVKFEPKLSGFNKLRIRCIAYSFLIPWDGKIGTSQNLKVETIINDFLHSDGFQSSKNSISGMDLFGLATYIHEIIKLHKQ